MIDRYILLGDKDIVKFYISYTPNLNKYPYPIIFFKPLYFEVEDPSILNLNLTISHQFDFKTPKLSFLQFEDDFVDNTKNDATPTQPNFHSEEKYFIDNTSPEYLQSVIGLDNGTIIQNGLVMKLNNILMNLMLGEKPNTDVIKKTLLYENITSMEKERRIKNLENMLNSLNLLLMKVSRENGKLKDDIKQLAALANSSNSNNLNGTNDLQNQNINKILFENLTNAAGNFSQYLNKSNPNYIGNSLADLVRNEITGNFSKGTIIIPNPNASFNLTPNEDALFNINFTCIKSGLSKIRLHFVPQNEYNPFNPVNLPII